LAKATLALSEPLLCIAVVSAVCSQHRKDHTEVPVFSQGFRL